MIIEGQAPSREDSFKLFSKSLQTEKPDKREARKLFIEMEREQIELSQKLKSAVSSVKDLIKQFTI